MQSLIMNDEEEKEDPTVSVIEEMIQKERIRIS